MHPGLIIPEAKHTIPKYLHPENIRKAIGSIISQRICRSNIENVVVNNKISKEYSKYFCFFQTRVCERPSGYIRRQSLIII